MLDALRGNLIRNETDFVVLDVNGMRFRAEIPTSSASALPSPGEETTLLTRVRFNMNEGVFDLFGFATETERECFDILTSMSGIGPRKGLMILSQIDIAGFARAIIEGDITYVSKIKGIGKKTAERLVVELREKMVPYTKSGTTFGPGESETILPETDTIRDAVEALVVLGCRQAVAEKAIAEAIKELGDDTQTEALIRVGLRYR